MIKKEVVIAIHNSYYTDECKYTSDGNVALMIDGLLECAIQTERVTRMKYDGSYIEAVSKMLFRYNLNFSDVDKVLLSGFAKDVNIELNSLDIYQQVKKYFLNSDIEYTPSHHEIHAWTGLLECSDKKSLIVVVDNTGSILEYAADNDRASLARVEQTSYYLWDGQRLELIDRDHDGFAEVGYGRFYSKVTRYIGFDSYHDAGKTMGLAPIYAKDTELPEAYTSVSGREVTSITHNKYNSFGLKDLSQWFIDKSIKIEAVNKSKEWNMKHAKLAKWAQESIEKSLIRKINHLKTKHNFENIIMTGGVALNSVLNAKVEEQVGIEVIIPPSPGDSGLALGLLAKYYFKKNKALDIKGYSAYLGFEYGETEVMCDLLKRKNEITVEKLESDDVAKFVSKELAKNNVVALYQGRSEFGPRALGNRSILANPTNPWTKEIINNGVKKREWFRPFAPVVMSEHINDYFKVAYTNFDYMMKVGQVAEEKGRIIPSVIHNDYSARLQTIEKTDNRLYYEIINEFYNVTGVPILMNTSFNLGGFPLVESPLDAIDCFIDSEFMSCLIINDYVIRKA